MNWASFKYLLGIVLGFCYLESTCAQQVSTFNGTEPGIVVASSEHHSTPAQNIWSEAIARAGAATVGRIGYQIARSTMQRQLEQALAGQARYLPNRTQNAAWIRALMCQVDVAMGARNQCIPADNSIAGRARAVADSLKILSVNDIRNALKIVHGGLIDRVTPAVLRTEVSTQIGQRAVSWQNRLKAVTNACIDQAATTIGATLCFTRAVLPAETSPLQTNLGTAVVLETSRLSLDSMSSNPAQFRGCRGDEYLRCMGVSIRSAPTGCEAPSFPAPANPNVQACALRSIHNGIMQVAEGPIESSIRQMAPADQIGRINGIATQTLRNCLPGKQSESAITGCFDQTVIAAGREIVEAKVLAEPAVREHFSSATERQRVADQGVAAFNACAVRAQGAGRRTNRILNINNCEAAVTNQVGRLVIESTFERTDPEASATGLSALRGCWPGNEASAARANACMRSSIVSFAAASGRRQVELKVPQNLKISQPTFIDTQISGLQSCLTQNLPTNIMTAQNLDRSIDSCTQALTLNVAKGVGRAEVTQILKDQMTPEDLEALLVAQVDGAFLTCLGQNPGDEELTRCESVLRHDVGVAAGAILLPKSINDYVTNQGGAAALGTTDEAISALSNDLVARNTTCLGENRARINEALNECFRSTINQAVGEVAVLQVRNELKGILPIAPSLVMADQEARARELITQCLARDVAADAELSATLEKIDPCGEEVTSQMRREVMGEVIVLTRQPIDLIFTHYQDCLNRRRRNCDEAMTREVQAFMRPFKDMVSASCPPGGTPDLDIFELASVAMISLIKESRGRFDEARAEVATLVGQFADVASGVDSTSRESLVADNSTDPILQTLIRGLLRESIRGIPADAGISAAVQAQLVDENLIREIFNSDVLREIKASTARLVENEALDQKSLEIDGKELQMAVARTFLGSSRVMGIILQGQINNEISRHGPLVRWIAPLAAGVMGMDLNWEAARRRSPAQEAETWVLENVILPMVDKSITPEEAANRQRQAAEMVKTALRRR